MSSTRSAGGAFGAAAALEFGAAAALWGGACAVNAPSSKRAAGGAFAASALWGRAMTGGDDFGAGGAFAFAATKCAGGALTIKAVAPVAAGSARERADAERSACSDILLGGAALLGIFGCRNLRPSCKAANSGQHCLSAVPSLSPACKAREGAGPAAVPNVGVMTSLPPAGKAREGAGPGRSSSGAPSSPCVLNAAVASLPGCKARDGAGLSPSSPCALNAAVASLPGCEARDGAGLSP